MRLTRLLPPVLLMLLAACATPHGDGPSSEQTQRLAQRAAAVTIFRDDFGVPHVYAATDADAVFGML